MTVHSEYSRFFAGPIVHKISPLGLLFGSAVVGTAGLVMLGMPFSNTAWLWLGAVTIYGVGFIMEEK